MSGRDLRIRIASNTTEFSDTQQSETSHPAKSNSNIEMSVSTEDPHTPGKVQPPEKESGTDKSRVKMRGYVVDNFQRNVVSGKTREPSTGSSYGVTARFQKKNKEKNKSVRVDYTIAGNEYAEPYTDDYMSQDFKVGYRWDLDSNWRVKTVGQLGLYEYGSEYGFRPELTYRFSPRSAFSFYGGHRSKVVYYDQDRIDQDRFLGFKYKSRFGHQSLELGYQRNFNDSEKSRYDYVRSKYTIGYNVFWNKTARTLFRLDYSPKEYQGRFITLEYDPELNAHRLDQGWTFSVASRISYFTES